MVEYQENVLLSECTTFHIGGPARYFCSVTTIADLREALKFAQNQSLPVFIMGGGSNVLVSDKGFGGLVVKLNNQGIQLSEVSETHIRLTVQAGQNWDSVVAYAVEQGLWGIENLSHIPGNSGAFVVQNVGAYGQEASQVLESVNAYDRQTGELRIFTNVQCHFGYRSSIFNTSQKDQYVIISLNLLLSKNPQPNISYGDLSARFGDRDLNSISLQEIRNAIIDIRNQKFPFPNAPERGNAGSFFRGPVMSAEKFESMKQKIHDLFGNEVAQRLGDTEDRLKVPQGYKTPTAFLLDVCGYKGLQIGGAQINPNQPAIVLNSTGKATAQDVLDLYHKVHQEILNKTGVELEHEPEFIGF